VRFTPSPHALDVVSELPTLWVLIVSLTTVAGLALAWLASKFAVSKQPAPPVLPLAAAQPARTADTDKASDEPMLNPLYQHQDILDITVIEEDEDILGLKEATGKKSAAGN